MYYKPIYVQFVMNITNISSIQIVILSTILLFTLITVLLASLYNITDILSDFWLCYFSGIFIVVLGIIFLNEAWHRHIKAFKFIKLLVIDEKSQDELMNSFYLIYKSPVQIYLAFMLSFIGSIVIISIYPEVPIVLKIYTSLLGFLCTFIAVLGCWCGFTSIIFLRKILSFEKLRVNPLAPGQTIGIVQLSKLMTDYATLFAMELATALVPFVYISLTAELRTPPINLSSLPYQISLSLFMLFFIISVPTYFLYPRNLIYRRVLKEKNDIIMRIENRIHDYFYSDECPKASDLDRINYYTNLLNTVVESKVYPRNANSTLKFLGSMVIPTIMMLMSQPMIFSSVMGYFRNVMFGNLL